ncbi:MAG: carboxylate--amine ligase [Acidiferrobacterales bacterium]
MTFSRRDSASHRVLILDGNQRSALAATRSLGGHGVHVVVAAETTRSLSGSSRYCRDSFSYPSPSEQPLEFLDNIQKNAALRNVRVLMPMTEVTGYLLARHRDRFAPAALPLPDVDSWELLANKCSLMQLAEQLDIPVPKSLFTTNVDEIQSASEQIGFPVILKPCLSKIWHNERCISTGVHAARNHAELVELTTKHAYFRDFPLVVQSFVPGTGHGIFVLYDHGRAVTFFAHRRVREKPPEGGVSVLSESVPLRADLQAYATRLLDRAHWHGVAMVEFRCAQDGAPYLMEVNPRFWGSLQLSIDAGVDFPSMLYDLAHGNSTVGPASYRVGVRTRWLLGDLDRLYLVLKGRNENPDGFSRLNQLMQFMRLAEKNTRYEINRFDDFRPFLFEIGQYIRQLGS